MGKLLHNDSYKHKKFLDTQQISQLPSAEVASCDLYTIKAMSVMVSFKNDVALITS